MQREDLENAARRALEIAKPMRAEQRQLDGEAKHHKRLQTELEEVADGTAFHEYETNARKLFGVLIRLRLLVPGLEAAQRLEDFLRYIGTSWRICAPGYGTGSVYFFVRSYRIDDGKLIAYDPFWPREVITGYDTKEGLEYMALYMLWSIGLPARLHGGGTLCPPQIATAKPFGPETEAARIDCPACKCLAYVVGHKELPAPFSENDRYTQGVYALCLECPRLTLIAERSDSELVKLHP